MFDEQPAGRQRAVQRIRRRRGFQLRRENSAMGMPKRASRKRQRVEPPFPPRLMPAHPKMRPMIFPDYKPAA